PVYEHLYRVVALPDLARLAAVGMAGGFVHVFDTVTGRLVERIPAGRNIADIKLWPGMPGVLVAATEERQVHAIDLALLKIERSFEFPEPIGYIAVGESGRVAAAATGVFAVSRTGARLKEGRVYLFNPHENAAPRASDALVAGTASREPIFVRDDTLLLVPNFGAATVSAFDVETRKLYRTLDVGAGPERVVTGPDGNLAYVMNTRGASVTVIRLSPLEVVRHVPLPGNPERAVVSPDGRFLIATLPRPRGGDDGDGEPMPSPSWAPFFVDGARAPAIDDSPGNRVVLVDLRTFTVADIIPARDDPADIVSSADGRRVFVANFGDDSVSIFE
ncbi:YncE family protein, partial [bacterium]|nr:YncE family protein [bacterium]